MSVAWDRGSALALGGAFLLLVLCYGVRLLRHGRARFERTERQGGSPLLGKRLMEMGAWGLGPLARGLIALRVSPNQISWASLVLGALAGVCAALGRFGATAVALTLSSLLDSLDGRVARATGVASDAGEVLDASVDRYAEFFFLAGLVLYYRRAPFVQAITLLALCGSFMVSYSSAKAEALGLSSPPGIMRRPERAFYLILGTWLSAFSSGDPVSFPSCLAPMSLAITFVGVLANVSAILRLMAIARQAGADPPPSRRVFE